ncbi:putative Aldose reductase B [Paratrimastix pyriformis]|uniref:Aldose reductase B n=1 Tax=Paratrimastix pyriformis TaxID=342808 RepID=A0ABQ8UNY3_9EUKA|nr:putative Aldose reductase B [Paratrimastix pyriformis]
MSSPTVDTILLNSGHRIPRLGLGTWQSPSEEVRGAVVAAIEAGYRHIDTARVYKNEAAVGDGIQEAISRGLVRREDLFVTTKLWCTDHHPSRVLEACQKSLERLKLQYLDLYLVHWPVAWKPFPASQPDRTGLEPGMEPAPEIEKTPFFETWRAMEDLVDRGLVRSIGVCNCTPIFMHDLLSYARIRPAVCQVEMHPYMPQPALVQWCNKEGIHVTAYSPLGSTDRVPRLLEDAVLREVGAKYGRSPAAVALRWAYQREGASTSVIPKSVHAARIRENFELTGWALDQADMDRLSSLPTSFRYVHPAQRFGVPLF